MKIRALWSLLAVLVAATPAFPQASNLANCKYYMKVQQDHVQGMQYCAEAIKENPEDPEARFYGAWCLAQGGRLDEAWESFNWLIERKDSKDKAIQKHAKMATDRVGLYYREFFNGGIEQLKAEDVQGANESFHKATQIDPRETNAYLNYGYTQVQLDDLDGAIESFETAVAGKPDEKVALEYYWDALSRKLDRLRAGDPVDDAAVAGVSAKLTSTLEKLLSMDPAMAGAHLKLADLKLAAGDKDSALEHMRKSIEIDAEKVIDLANIGIEFYQNDDYQASTEALAVTLEYVTDPEDEIWKKSVWVKGLAHYEAKEWESALVEFEKLLALEPDNMDYLPRAGMAARKAGKQDRGDELLIRWEELKEAAITGGE